MTPADLRGSVVFLGGCATPQQTVIEQVQQLRAQLEEIDKRPQGAPLPMAVLEDLKGAVDHLRTTLWAAMSANTDDPDALASKVASLRLQRAAEICRQIRLDIDANQVDINSAELPKLREALHLTVNRVERLYKSGM
ncbi:MAG: hypothetical protein ACLPXM_20055 [Terriglobales bacterium]